MFFLWFISMIQHFQSRQTLSQKFEKKHFILAVYQKSSPENYFEFFRSRDNAEHCTWKFVTLILCYIFLGARETVLNSTAKRFFVQLGCGLISRCQSGSYETQPAKKARKKQRKASWKVRQWIFSKYLEILAFKYGILTLLASHSDEIFKYLSLDAGK